MDFFLYVFPTRWSMGLALALLKLIKTVEINIENVLSTEGGSSKTTKKFHIMRRNQRMYCWLEKTTQHQHVPLMQSTELPILKKKNT